MTTKPSRTAQKREAQAVQAPGEQRIGLAVARLGALPHRSVGELATSVTDAG